MPLNNDNYPLSITHTAVAQIIYAQAERISQLRHTTKPGVKAQRPLSPEAVHVTSTVVDSLADIATSFVEQIGQVANVETELSGRTRSTMLDVLSALDSLSSISNSSSRDLAKYAMYQEIPFPFPVPPFPVAPAPRKPQRDLYIETEEKRERNYIESWMPPLPSSHTYISTPVYVNRATKRRAPEDIRDQRRSVEKSLAKLKEAQAGGERDERLLAAAAAAVPDNPFFAPPKVGAGRIFDEDTVGEARDIIEPAPNLPKDAYDSNVNLIEVPKGANHEQKRARAERVLAETAGRAGHTATSGTQL